MTLAEFYKQIAGIEQFYGKEYNQEQKKVFYEELKGYPLEKFIKAIEQIRKTSRYAPMLNELLEAIKQVKLNQRDEEKVPCEFCKGTGYVRYTKIENGYPYEYFCLCTCKNAEGKEYNGRTISDKEHRSDYYIKTAQEVFGDIKAREKKAEPINANLNDLKSSLLKQMSL